MILHLTYGRNYGRSTGAERLGQAAALICIKQLLHADAALLGLISLILSKPEYALAGNSGKYAAFKRGGYNLAVYYEHHVHRADFFNILVFASVKPKNLIKALFGGVKRCFKGCGVVSSGLGGAYAALDGADIIILNMDAERLHSVLVISAGR